MKFTLIPDDRMVYVNGDARKLDDDIKLPHDIHAVQWYDTWGEIEYKPDHKGNLRPNEKFTDFSRFQHHVVHHANAVKRDFAEARRKLEEQEKAALNNNG